VWRDDLVLAADGRRLAELLRAEGHGLADEICTEIRRTIPEYAAPPEPPVRPVVDRALAMFVRRIAEPAAPARPLNET
jgi:hypothetical protein